MNNNDNSPNNHSDAAYPKTLPDIPISLDKDSVMRIEALNIMKYTLLLGAPPEHGIQFENGMGSIRQDNHADASEKSSIINEIIAQCRSICQSLFIDDSNLFYKKDFYYNFFGFSPLIADSQESASENKQASKLTRSVNLASFYEIGMIPSEEYFKRELAIKKKAREKASKSKDKKASSETQDKEDSSSKDEDEEKALKKEINDISKPFLHNLIIQHCVMSCYHSVRTQLNSLNHTDIHEIDREYILHTLMDYFKQIPKSEKIPTEQNLRKTFEIHEQAIPFFDFDLAALTMPQITLDLLQVHASYYKRIFFPYSLSKKDKKYGPKKGTLVEHTIKTKLRNLLKLADELYVKKSKGTSPTVEEVYQNYIFERLFNVRLIYSITSAMLYIKKTKNFDLSNPLIINNLCACKYLPNAYSRQAILWYAILHIRTMTNTRYNYWNHHNSIPSYPMDSDNPFVGPSTFDFYEWSRQFRLFCKYLADYIIPVYEWCFTDILFSTLESAKDSSGSNNLLPAYKDRLIAAKNLLEAYITEHVDSITSPITIAANSSITQDMMDIFTPFSIAYHGNKTDFSILENTPKDAFMTIRNISDDSFNILFRSFINHSNDTNLGISEKLTFDHIRKIIGNVSVDRRDTFYSTFCDHILLLYSDNQEVKPRKIIGYKTYKTDDLGTKSSMTLKHANQTLQSSSSQNKKIVRMNLRKSDRWRNQQE